MRSALTINGSGYVDSLDEKTCCLQYFPFFSSTAFEQMLQTPRRAVLGGVKTAVVVHALSYIATIYTPYYFLKKLLSEQSSLLIATGFFCGALLEAVLSRKPVVDKKILPFWSAALKASMAGFAQLILLVDILAVFNRCAPLRDFFNCESIEAVSITLGVLPFILPFAGLVGYNEYSKYQGRPRVSDWFRLSTRTLKLQRIVKVSAMAAASITAALSLDDFVLGALFAISQVISDQGIVVSFQNRIIMKLASSLVAMFLGAMVENRYQKNRAFGVYWKGHLSLWNEFFQIQFFSFLAVQTLFSTVANNNPILAIVSTFLISAVATAVSLHDEYYYKCQPLLKKYSSGMRWVSALSDVVLRVDGEDPRVSHSQSDVGPSRRGGSAEEPDRGSVALSVRSSVISP